MLLKNQNIFIIMNKISRSGGGNSTALDLCETLYSLGFNVSIGLTNDTLLSLLRHSNYKKTSIPFKNIFIVPKVIERAIRKPVIKHNMPVRLYLLIKLTVELFLNYITGRQNKFFRFLSDAEIIFIASVISDKGIATIRSYNRAVIVRNHAGSSVAFEKFFLKNRYLNERADSDNSRYINYCKRYDALLFQSTDQAQECAKRVEIMKSRCFVVPPSCQENKVLAASLLATPYQQDRRSIVYVGSIQPRKAQHIAIEAFAKMAEKHPDTDLHFVGGNHNKDYSGALIKMAKQSLFSKRIFLHGHRKDYLRFMAHAEIVIQTSEAEGVSRILREAMLMKKPIISFSISGTSMLLRSGIDALLIEPSNTTAFSDAMSYFLSNPSIAEDYAASAYKKYLLNNSWAAYASNLKMLIEDLSDLWDQSEK